MYRPRLTARRRTRFQGVDQALGKRTRMRPFEGFDHGGRDAIVRKQIARRNAVAPRLRRDNAEPFRPGHRFARTVGVEYCKLSPLGAPNPCASKFRPSTPRRGSVTFWLNTTPCGLTHKQRLGTAMLELHTMPPTMPVRSHRPASEKVIRRLRSTIWNDGNHVDLNQPLGPRER